MWPLSVIVTGIVDDEPLPLPFPLPPPLPPPPPPPLPLPLPLLLELWATGLTAVILPLTCCRTASRP